MEQINDLYLTNNLLIEILSSPNSSQEIIDTNLEKTDGLLIEILAFRKILEFNEKETLIRPFIHTLKYVHEQILQDAAQIYLSRYGLKKSLYTKKVKLFGLILIRLLWKCKVDQWIIDIARYEFILFSHIWLKDEDSHHFYKQSNKLFFKRNICKLAEFSFNVKSYFDNHNLLHELVDAQQITHLLFLGKKDDFNVGIIKLDKTIYSFLKFCHVPRTSSEIYSFLQRQNNKTEIYNSTEELIKILLQRNVLCGSLDFIC